MGLDHFWRWWLLYQLWFQVSVQYASLIFPSGFDDNTGIIKQFSIIWMCFLPTFHIYTYLGIFGCQAKYYLSQLLSFLPLYLYYQLIALVYPQVLKKLLKESRLHKIGCRLFLFLKNSNKKQIQEQINKSGRFLYSKRIL